MHFSLAPYHKLLEEEPYVICPYVPLTNTKLGAQQALGGCLWKWMDKRQGKHSWQAAEDLGASEQVGVGQNMGLPFA